MANDLVTHNGPQTRHLNGEHSEWMEGVESGTKKVTQEGDGPRHSIAPHNPPGRLGLEQQNLWAGFLWGRDMRRRRRGFSLMQEIFLFASFRLLQRTRESLAVIDLPICLAEEKSTIRGKQRREGLGI